MRGEAECPPEIVASLFRHVAVIATQRRHVSERPKLTRRELQIGTHLVSVAPSVSVAKLTCGVTVTASGQEDRLSARWIVTWLTLA